MANSKSRMDQIFDNLFNLSPQEFMSRYQMAKENDLTKIMEQILAPVDEEVWTLLEPSWCDVSVPLKGDRSAHAYFPKFKRTQWETYPYDENSNTEFIDVGQAA